MVLGRVHIDRHPGVDAFFGLYDVRRRRRGEGRQREGGRDRGNRAGRGENTIMLYVEYCKCVRDATVCFLH